MRILHNARVYTLDPTHPVASTIVINEGKVLAVGDGELGSEGKDAVREDMGGRVILPGLTDAHIHLQEYALSLQIVECGGGSKEENLHRLANHIQKSQPGEWVRGHGWDQNEWDGKWPTARDLDALGSKNPIYLTARSLHVAWVNSLAMERAGILPLSPDPVNGRIQRNDGGTPTGILFEGAMNLVETVIPKPSPGELAKTFQQVIPGLWRMGLTGGHDFDVGSCFQALQILQENGDLQFRVIKSIPYEQLPHAVALGLRSGYGNDFLRIGSIKLFADGALGPHTGAMFESYVDEPLNRGILLLDNEQLFEHGCLAAMSGLSLAVHAIGDRAVHEVLEGFARLRAFERERALPVLRHRIEHVQTIHPGDAGRLAELDVIASMQPIHATSDMLVADRLLGDRAAFSYAWQTQIQNGARLVFGSDAPVESPNPFHGLHAAITRRRADGSPSAEGWFPQERLTVQEAFEGFTVGPAYAAGMENRLGRLSPGFLADLIVIETDPFSCDPMELHDVKPTSTMVGGDWVWKE
jgi:predicted amidohydrolase YtcJ